MKKILFTTSLMLMNYCIYAQPDCEDADRGYHIQIISKEFNNLPSDPAIQELEKKYFSLTSLATCLYLLKADITDERETSLVYRRVTDIALKYIEADLLIVLAGGENNGKVTEIFNQYATKFQVKYISMGIYTISFKVDYAIGLFNQQIEQHLLERNGKEWRKDFHAGLEDYYNEQLEKLSRKERKNIRKKNRY